MVLQAKSAAFLLDSERSPSQRLGDYHAWKIDAEPGLPIDMMWVSKACTVAPLPHLVLPHGEPSIAIRRRRNLSGDLASLDFVVCGPSSDTRHFTPLPGEELIAIRLRPEFSAIAFGVRAQDFRDSDPVSKKIGACGVADRALKVAENGTAAEVAQALLFGLMSVDPFKAYDLTPESQTALLLRETNGGVSIRDIAKRLEVSERHLRRRFQDATGMSPKAYARQLRVTAAAQLADHQEAPDWAMIALEVGYFDQAHMIADFKQLCDRTPVETHADRRILTGPGLPDQSKSAFSNTEAPEAAIFAA